MCWQLVLRCGFDGGVGMTYFDITKLHGLKVNDESREDNEVAGSIIEIDYCCIFAGHE